MSEPQQVYTTSQAFTALTKQASLIETLETQRNTARDAYEVTEDKLREAQERFNDLREQTIGLFPALETGFSMKRETVRLIDGQVQVVEA